MLKMWPLCIDAKLNLRILGDVKKDGFISLPGKGGHSRPMPSKTVFPNPGGSAEELYSNGSKGRVADEDQDVCKVYIPLIRLRCLLK